jgi:hypothetical protein
MRLLVIGLAAALAAGSAWAHDGHDPGSGKGNKPPPLAVLQLDMVRDAASRFIDVDEAEAGGYHDMGLFVEHMGWHYINQAYVDDGRFDPLKPELLVYADDPCGGKRKLVAVEYAVPLTASRRAPYGFFGVADEWDRNTTFGLWTLHAWVFEYNTDGVFAPFNQRIP